MEAENIYEAWKLVQRWFEMMESSEAQYRHPDPRWNGEDYPNKVPLTQKVADRFIEEMDADFLLEKSRFEGKEAPDFARLPSHARLAFVQEAYGILKTTKEISKEAEKRFATGEIMPPLP
ncbi:hypothetical protein IIA94_00375 [Patescibacteria group bacterium]|nr:hypothetical protein [Patescibacteria group bacterium]